jgi:hypothetical protein
MDSGLHRAWTQIVTAEDYEEHMAAIGQAQAGAALTQYIIQSANAPAGGRVAIVGAGTGQMLDFLDLTILRPFRIIFTDLNPGFLVRLRERLSRHALTATVLEDDIEQTALDPGPDLLLATLLLEHIDWCRGLCRTQACHLRNYHSREPTGHEVDRNAGPVHSAIHHQGTRDRESNSRPI